MNIQEAKEHISNAITAYRTRDEFGKLRIPQHRQRPVFLVGAPGLGKTAIMQQIAEEMQLPLVSYSMTHHTRQSALGLPFIEKKLFGGEEYRVSEYTMSEIIATVYRTMEATGKKEGILFLDEVNCVSETLAPAMLQFLQYKVFGMHTLPEGWIVTTAGNPPEYNDSVREFDMATMDRVKRLDIEPDLEIWFDYAKKRGIHPAITSYLYSYKDQFCKQRKTADGMEFVTPRSWEDLSEMITLYELHDLTVDPVLVAQYLQYPEIARGFAAYYDLFKRYRSDYQVDKILDGRISEEIVRRAKAAKLDERLALLSLLLNGVQNKAGAVVEKREMLERLRTKLRDLERSNRGRSVSLREVLEKQISVEREELKKAEAGNMLSAGEQRIRCSLIVAMESFSRDHGANPFAAGYEALRGAYKAQVEGMKRDGAAASTALDNAFIFCERAFGDGETMLIFVTDLTCSETMARFIAQYDCPRYFKHNANLLLPDRLHRVNQALKDLKKNHENDGKL